jgi:hypothetical protein
VDRQSKEISDGIKGVSYSLAEAIQCSGHLRIAAKDGYLLHHSENMHHEKFSGRDPDFGFGLHGL